MKHLFGLLFLSFTLFSCRDFYDEEFENGTTVSPVFENATYEVDLESTNTSLTDMSGNAILDIQDGNVDLTISLSGIPQNIIQVHYGYSPAPCANLSFAFPVEMGTTRNYNISETLASEALTFDIRNAGASPDLEGASLVIKAFSSVSDAGGTGGQVFTIACGELIRNDNAAVDEAQ